MMFHVRFDDAREGTSRVLSDPIRALVAFEASDVPGVLAGAEAAAEQGLWVGGYVAYEAAGALDPALGTTETNGGPLAWFGVFSGCIEERLDADAASGLPPYTVSPWQPAMTPERYAAAFGVVKDAIRRGDSYQVNLTFPLVATFDGSVDHWYRDLIRSQRPAYAAHIRHDTIHVVSVSPERFFSVEERTITTTPMKGTARRGRWQAEDAAVRDALAASEKDRAENLMIVDLLRNDVGRVARFGTVRVDELFALERFPTVWQMTSTVAAELRDDINLVDIFGALFPCGSVTGAPKASSMGIIDEIEVGPRGVYCGAIGFIPPGTGLDGASFSVAIRTAVVDEERRSATYGVGGGITWYSDADLEYAETATKALVLTREPPRSLIETIRWDPATDPAWYWIDEHLARLAASADHWGFAVDPDEVAVALDHAVAVLDRPTKVRVEVVADGTIVTTVDDAPAGFPLVPDPADDAVRLAVAKAPIDETDPVFFHKVGDRSIYESFAREAGESDDVLLWNQGGFVTETTIANVVFLIDGVWVTPPVADGLLGGVMRGHLIETEQVVERSVSVAEALAATSVGVVNSVRGWRHAVIVPPPDVRSLRTA